MIDLSSSFAQEKIKNPYYVHIPIIKLQPGQEISFSTITNINIEKNDPLYSPCSVCFFKQNSENDYDFIIDNVYICLFWTHNIK